MKNLKFTLLLTMIFPLVSCNPLNTSTDYHSSFTSSNTASTSNSSSSENIVFNQQSILDKIKEASKGNFQLTYSFQGKIFNDVYSKDYIYKGYLNSGSILLPFSSFRVIDYRISNNKVKLLGQTYSQKTNKQDLKNLDEFNKLNDLFNESSKLSIDDFEKNDDGFSSTSSILINALSSLLDFSTGIAKIDFYLSNNKDLCFELKVKQPDGSLITPDGGKVYLENIGQAKLSALDEFLNSWKLPKDTPIDKANNLKNTDFSFTTDIYEVSQVKKLIQNQTFDSNNGLFKITKKNAEGLLYSNEVLKKNNDNSLNELSIDGQNKLLDEKSNTYPTIDDLYLINKSNLDLNEFYLQEDGSYQYFGDKSSLLLPFVVKDSTFWKYNISQIKLVTKDNNIASIKLVSELLQDSSTGEIFNYEFDVNILDKVNTIQLPSKKDPSSKDGEIKNYFSKITSEDSNFIAIKNDSSWEGKRKTYYTKTNDIYIKQTYVMLGEDKQNIESSYGYYLKNGKIYDFTYQNGKYVIQGSGYESSLSSKINFTASSEVFYIDNKDNYLKTYSDISYIGKNIAFSDYPLDVVSSSLKMTITDNSISKIEYNYSNKEISGIETIDITYDNAILDPSIKKELDEQIPEQVTKKTWKDDKSQVVYDALVSSFNENVANLVPYLYDEKLSGTFDGYENDTNDFRIYSMGEGLTEEEKSTYISNYKNLLVTLGYVTNDNSTYINAKDNLQIVVGNTLDEFLQIGLINI